LGQLGAVVEHQTVECQLQGTLPQSGEISVCLEPTSRDGVTYLSREAGSPGQLIVEYLAEP
jgi:hypothetical protein